jgi:hypothetical protein
MAKGEEHVCIGCGVHVTTHESQLCMFCGRGSAGLPTVTQTQFATRGKTTDPRRYPHNLPDHDIHGKHTNGFRRSAGPGADPDNEADTIDAKR